MVVTFYRAPNGQPPEDLGSVRLGPDGSAVWDPSLESLLGHDVYDAREGKVLDPSDGVDYLRRLPYVFDNAPYLWAAT